MHHRSNLSVSRCKRRALTLIELLTVIAIVGVLAGILAVTIGKTRQNAQNISALSKLRASALSLLSMASSEDATLKVWKGGTAGTAGAWSRKLFDYGYLEDSSAFYNNSGPAGIRRPASNWYLYTWGINVFDTRRQQSLNNLEDGFQIRLDAIDNPSDTILLADTILISSASNGDLDPLQTFRLLAGTGVDNGTGSGLRTRDGKAVLLSFYDGHVEQADFKRLHRIGVRRVIDETGKIVSIPTP